MPPLDAKARLRHVVDAGESIQSLVKGATFVDYEASDLMRLAVERQFTIIG